MYSLTSLLVRNKTPAHAPPCTPLTKVHPMYCFQAMVYNKDNLGGGGGKGGGKGGSAGLSAAAKRKAAVKAEMQKNQVTKHTRVYPTHPAQHSQEPAPSLPTPSLR